MLGDLSDRDRAILTLEAAWPRHGGMKEETIRTQLGMSPARYYQLLGRLIETEQALQFDPLLVRRLRRLRDARSAQRSSRMRGFVG
ncbi:DUF3263 domain-containing protein [Microbacterium esteraromaticum]|uniref:DUF3263 domain-containing protein n=1 Tax=Microbacterium esteraromaticum TaxID=57043 RepID=UPI002368B564|nr:DUF3263 domain-containing protein [Microbacterium esteraromaticum]WDH78128.1 DUF3263 domain-containing protein [Microbacterium esteraromaticum]